MAYPFDDLQFDTSYAASIGQQPPPLDAAGVLPGEFPPPQGFAPPPSAAPVDFLAGELPPPPEPIPTFLSAPGIAPPPSAAPPPSLIPTIAPPPVAFPIELQRPLPTQIQQSAQELAQANAGIEEAQAQIDRLNGREAQLRAELPTADPARQLAIAGELDATGRERAGIVTTRDTLRADAGRSAERGAVALETRQAEVMREEMAVAERELEAAKREAEEKRKTADEEAARTTEQVNRDTQAYRDALARKDPGADWQGVVEIVSESFMAGMQRRPPNFASIIDRSAARSRANIADRAQAAATALGLSKDSLAGQQAIRQEIDVQEKARRVAVYEEATSRVQERMRTESDPLERARLGGQLDMLRQQRESAMATAEQARAEQERTRRLADEKMQIEREKADVGISKTRAEIEKLTAETRKLTRGGPGKPKVQVGPSDLRQMGLTEKQIEKVQEQGALWQGRYLVNADGTPWTAPTAAEAKDVRNGIGATGEANNLVVKMIALRRSYGSGNWASLDDSKKKSLTSMGALLLGKVNKAMQLGALDNGTVEILGDALGDPSGFFDNETQLTTYQQTMQDDLNIKLRDTFGYTGAPITIERAEAVPVKSVEDYRTIIEQEPSQAGTVMPADDREKALEGLYSRLVVAAGGDTRKASQEYDAYVRRASDLNLEYRKEVAATRDAARPDGYDQLVSELRAAKGEELLRAGQPGETERKRKVERAKVAIDKAVRQRDKELKAKGLPTFTKLTRSLGELDEFHRALVDKTSELLTKQTTAQQVEEEESRRRAARESAFEDVVY